MLPAKKVFDGSEFQWIWNIPKNPGNKKSKKRYYLQVKGFKNLLSSKNKRNLHEPITFFFFHNILGGNALTVSTSQRRYGRLSDDRTKCHMPDSPPHGIHFHLAHHRKVRLFTVINQLRDCDIIMTYLFRILNYEKINHIDHFEYWLCTVAKIIKTIACLYLFVRYTVVCDWESSRPLLWSKLALFKTSWQISKVVMCYFLVKCK